MGRAVLRRAGAHLAPTAGAEAAASPAERTWNNGDVRAPRAIAESDYPHADSLQPELTPAEAEHFRRHGWLIKRAFTSAELLVPFVEQIWERAQEHGIRRDAPATHVDAGERWSNTPAERPGHGSNVEVLSADSRWWWGDIGHDPAFMAATCRHPSILRMVESLLGGPIKLPTRNRGIYTVWPQSEPELSLGPHVDSQSEELLATTIFGDVTASDGGFTFWPGSHTSMWYVTPNFQYEIHHLCCEFHNSQCEVGPYRYASDEEINWVQNDSFGDRMAKIRADTTPLIFTGGCGDTLFWHARLVHSTGVNYGTNVRVAAISDFRRAWPSSRLEWMVETDAGLTMRVKGHAEGGDTVGEASQRVRDGDIRSILPSLMWHHDVLEIADAHQPTNRDMWTEWNLGKEPPRGDIVVVDPWWVTYKMHPGWGERAGGAGSAPPPPQPPRELAGMLSKGAVLRDGEWWIDPSE